MSNKISNSDQLIRGEFLPEGIHDWAKQHQLEEARNGDKVTLQSIYEGLVARGWHEAKNDSSFRFPKFKGL